MVIDIDVEVEVGAEAEADENDTTIPFSFSRFLVSTFPPYRTVPYRTVQASIHNGIQNSNDAVCVSRSVSSAKG